MAVSVNVYTFAKKRNSTKQPSGAGQVYNCLLKDGTDVWAPTFIFSTNPGTSRNYLSAFGRYYYIDRLEYIPPHWHVTCTLDPLASYKTEIGSASLYVTRADNSVNWDKDITDNLPIDVGPYSYTDTISPYPFDYPDTGYYVVTLAGSLNSNGCTHVVFTPSQYEDFVQDFLDVGLWDMPSIVDDTWKSQINPIDYIQDVRWYPFVPGIVSELKPIYVNGWKTNANGYAMNENYIYHRTVGCTLHRHPDALTYGTFLNGAPYARYTLVDPFFGTIVIDPTIVAVYNTIGYDLYVDPSCGMGHVRITAEAVDHDPIIIADRTAQFGVPVLFSQETHGGVQGVLGSVGNTVSNLLSGNIAGAVGSFIGLTSEFGSTKLQTTGSVGSRAMYKFNIMIYSEFQRVKPIDYTTMGKPICKTLTISTLSGFVQVAKGDVAVAAPSWVADTIKTTLEGGFYYE